MGAAGSAIHRHTGWTSSVVPTALYYYTTYNYHNTYTPTTIQLQRIDDDDDDEDECNAAKLNYTLSGRHMHPAPLLLNISHRSLYYYNSTTTTTTTTQHHLSTNLSQRNTIQTGFVAHRRPGDGRRYPEPAAARAERAREANAAATSPPMRRCSTSPPSESRKGGGSRRPPLTLGLRGERRWAQLRPWTASHSLCPSRRSFTNKIHSLIALGGEKIKMADGARSRGLKRPAGQGRRARNRLKILAAVSFCKKKAESGS